MNPKVLACTLIALLLISAAVYALPLDKMTEQEKNDFYSLPGSIMPSSLGITEEDAYVSILVRSTDATVLDEAVQGNGWQDALLGGTLHNVVIKKNNARNLLLDNSISAFEVNRVEPLLNISSPSINSSTFYNADYNGFGSSICIVDTGINFSHEAFTDKTIENVDCNIYGHTDAFGHGTHVAGITASVNTEYKGIAYGANHIINAKGFDNFGFGICVIPNIERCFTNDRTIKGDVANNSWGSSNPNCNSLGYASDGNSSNSTYIDAVAVFYKKVLVFAIGNDGPYSNFCGHTPGLDQNTLATPGDAYNVISVASMDDNNTPSRSDDFVSVFSSRGPTWDGRKKPDITAPGSTIFTSGLGITSADFSNNTGYIMESGTSMSAPHVTGAAALAIATFGTNWLQTKALLINSAEDINAIGWDKYTGWGYLDLNRTFYEGNNTLFTSIDKNNSKNYSVTFNTGDKATLVWNRFCDENVVCSRLTDLNLYLYDANNNLVSSSTSLIDNVEQVRAALDDNYRIQVTSQTTDYSTPYTDENFALAPSKTTGPFVSSSKIITFTKSAESAQTSSPFYVDVNILNNSPTQQDYNLRMYDSNALLDTNSFTLAPFTKTQKRVTTTFVLGGTKNITLALSPISGELALSDNNYSFLLNVDQNNISVISAVVSSPQIYANSDQNQTLTIDANIYNRVGPAKDFNTTLFINGLLVDANYTHLEQGESKIVRFTETILAGTSGDLNMIISAPIFGGEFSTADNNFYLNYTLPDRNDSAVLGIDAYPSIIFASKDAQSLIIGANLINQLGQTRDINANLYVNGTYANSNHLILAVGESAMLAITQTIPATTFGDYNLLVSIPPAPSEIDTNDNNFSLPLYIEKIDINLLSVTPSSTSGTVAKTHAIRFDANVLNNGSSDKEVLLITYTNGSEDDSNTQSVPAGQARIISITKTFTTLDNNLVFSAQSNVYPQYEYDPSDNNKSLTYSVLDGNNAKILGTRIYGISPYYDLNRALINTTFDIDVNIGNPSIGSAVYDLNLMFFDNDTLISSNIIKNKQNDYNTITYALTYTGTGEHTYRFSVSSLDNETDLTDNNVSFDFGIDGNAIRTNYPSFTSSVNKDTNQKIDVNIQNFGPAVNTTLYLRNTTAGTIADQRTVSLGANSSAIYSLYTQTLSLNGTIVFNLGIPPLEREYTPDNNVNFSINVSTPSSNNNSPGSGGTGQDTSPPSTPPVLRTNTEDVLGTNTTQYLNPPSIQPDIQGTLTPEELSTANSLIALESFTRTLSDVNYFDAQGNATRKTKITLHNNATYQSAATITIVEYVPKTIAQDANQIDSQLSTTFTIRKADPVIAFTVPPGQDVIYYLSQHIDTNRIAEFSAPTVAAITLQQIVPAVQPQNDNTPLGANNDTNSNGLTIPGFDSVVTLFGQYWLIIILLIAICVLVPVAVVLIKRSENKKSTTPSDKKNETTLAANKSSTKTLVEKIANTKPVTQSRDASDSALESMAGAIGTENMDAAKTNSKNASFERTFTLEITDQKTVQTKVTIQIQKAFKKGVKTVKVIEPLPVALNLSDSDIQTKLTYKFLKGNSAIEFTITPSDDITYYITKELSLSDMNSFSTPAITTLLEE